MSATYAGMSSYEGFYPAPSYDPGFYAYPSFDESITQPHNAYYAPANFSTYPQQAGYQWQYVAMPPFAGHEVVTTSYPPPVSCQPPATSFPQPPPASYHSPPQASFHQPPPASFQPLPQVRTTREPHTKAPGGTPCAVCGDTASGCYNGVVVCLGCKTFFRRIVVTGEVEKIQCRYVGSCVVNKDLRNACRSCRFNKCLLAGMALEEKRGRHSAMVTSPPPTGWSKMLEITSCAVCSKIATEYHYDVALCDVCFGAVDSDRKDPVPSGKRMMHAPTTTFNEQFRYGNTVLTKFTEG